MNKTEDGDHWDGFLSYSHADASVARRVHSFLERYPLPEGKRRLRIFLDDTDLRAGELGQELERALSDARSLVVACSPAALDSRWVENEIRGFCTPGGERTVVPLLVRGEPDRMIPSRLRDLEVRFLDLRRGWWGGFLSPRYRIELARGVATIADLPLRTMVNWERRRQLRTAAFACLFAVCVVLAALFWPRHYVHDLGVGTFVGPLRSVEFGEVQEDRLLVAAREVMEGPQGYRNYVAFYPNALESHEWHWFSIAPLTLRTRLLPISLIDSESVQRMDAAVGLAAVRRTVSDAVDAIILGRAEGDEDLAEDIRRSAGPFWLGEPVEGWHVLIFPVPPSPVQLGDEGYVTPSSGDAVVVVARPDTSPLVATLTDFSVVDLSEVDPRAVDLRNGIPVAGLGDALWIGSRATEEGSPGGLWSSADGGATWSRIKRFTSIASIALDPYREGRVLVATAPGRWKSSVREGSRQTELWELKSHDASWEPLEHVPPLSASSRVNFVGFFRDGALAVQVDSDVYELARDHVARRLLGSYRRAVEPPAR